MSKFSITYVKDGEYHTEIVEANYYWKAREAFFKEHNPKDGYVEVCTHQKTGIEWDDRVEPFDLSDEEMQRIVDAEVAYHKVYTEAKKVVNRVDWFPSLVKWLTLIPLYICLIPTAVLAIASIPMFAVLRLIERAPDFMESKAWRLINMVYHNLGKRLTAAENEQKNIGFRVTTEHAREEHPELFAEEKEIFSEESVEQD